MRTSTNNYLSGCDPELEANYLLYEDANNLYGCLISVSQVNTNAQVMIIQTVVVVVDIHVPKMQCLRRGTLFGMVLITVVIKAVSAFNVSALLCNANRNVLSVALSRRLADRRSREVEISSAAAGMGRLRAKDRRL